MRSFDEIKKNPMVMVLPPIAGMPGTMMRGILKFDGKLQASFVCGSNEDGNEHVSIELYARRLPTWEEMSLTKDIFWEDEEEAVEIHPKKSEYVNITEALHLWRPKDGDWNRLMNGGR